MTVDELSVLITANNESFIKSINQTVNKVDDAKRAITKSVDSGQQAISKTVENGASGITKVLGVLKKGIIALGIGKVIKESISTAMETVESDNLFGYVLGNMAKETYEWSNEVSKALGLSAVAVRKNTGTIYSMTTSMGIAGDTALDMAKGVAMLANDMSAFYNIDSELAFSKIQSGLTGMSVPLKELGILIDDEIIKQTAYKKGIAKTGVELTGQQKVLARYVAILEQTRNAQGALSREMNTPANLIRRLKTEISNCANTIGTILMPIVSKALVYINAFVKVLSNALSSLASFLGFKSSLADDTSKASSNIGELAGSMADAESSAKKIKKSLAGFDEITNLTTPDADADTSGVDASGIPIGFNLGDYDAGLDSIEDKTKKIVDKITNVFKPITEKIKEIDFKPITEALCTLKTTLEPFEQGIWDGLKWGIDNVLLPLGEWTIEEVLPTFLNGLSGCLTSLTPILETFKPLAQWLWEELLQPLGEWVIEDLVPSFFNAVSGCLELLNPLIIAFKPLAQWLWDDFLQPIGKWTGGLIVDILQQVGEKLTAISDWASQNQQTIDTMVKTVATFFGLWELTKLMAFIEMSGGLIAAFDLITASIKACTLAKIADKLETVAIVALYAKDFIVSLAKGTAALVKQIVQWGILNGAKVLDAVVTGAATLAQTLWTVCATVGTAVTTALGVAFNVLCSPVTLVIVAIAALVAAGVALYKNWDTVMEWADKLGEKIKDVFGKVRDFVKETTDKISNFFKGMINKMIEGINTFIKGINKIKFDVPEWVPVIGGMEFGFNIKELPKLARGGIIDNPTIAMLGERGREAVVPLENNTEWLDKLAGKLFVMLKATKYDNDDRPINVTVTSTLNGKVVSKELIRDLNKEAKRLGYKGILTT